MRILNEQESRELARLRNRLGGKSADEVQAILDRETRELDARRDAERRESQALLERSLQSRGSTLGWLTGGLIIGLVASAGGAGSFGLGAPLFAVGMSLLTVHLAYRHWATRRAG